MYTNLFMCFFIASSLNPTTCKLYDVEMEAIKLFGEDLNTVLARFRRTPEYLDILTDRLAELKEERDRSRHQLLEIYRINLLRKIDGMFGNNTTKPNLLAFRGRNWFKRGGRNFRRHLNKHQNFSSYLAEAAEALDYHPIFQNILNVEERNRFTDVGFEFAGQLIHDLIQSMQPGYVPQMSTKQPWGDKEPKEITTTTEHKHVVTNGTPVTIYINALSTQNTGGSTAALKHYRHHKRLF